MSKRETTIEINGKRYDARSGALLTHGGGQPARSVDGFMPFKQVAPTMHHSKRPTAVASPHPQTVQQPLDITRPVAHHVAHHSAKKSQTLIRSAVKKPTEQSLKRHAKVMPHTHSLVANPHVAITKKLAHPQVDQSRARRATHVARSEQIQRYAHGQPMQPVASPQTQHLKPVHASTAPAHAVAAPHASSLDVFEHALQRANSHLETYTPAKSSKRGSIAKRVFGIASASLAILLVAGFIAYQNQASLTVKYASHKAGFAATLPAYKPAGFNTGKFAYSFGNVSIHYDNATNGQSFALVQRTSNWDSDALLTNYVENKDSNYQALQSAGRIIYTYGKNSATWVNGGVWYQIESNGNLSKADLVNVATSM